MSRDKGWLDQYRRLLPKAKAVVTGASSTIDDLKNCVQFAAMDGAESDALRDLSIDASQYEKFLREGGKHLIDASLSCLASDSKEESLIVVPSPDVALRNIERIRLLLQEADELEQHRDFSEVAARRKRIEAALLMVEAEKSGTDKTKLYKALGIHRKYGRSYFALAQIYAGIDSSDLDRRQIESSLLSLNQAVALERASSKLANEDERVRLVKKIRDDTGRSLIEPEFGPKAIEQLAGSMSPPEQTLREKLRIDHSRIEQLKATAPTRPVYGALFEQDRIRIQASSLPLAFAALTMTPESTAKSIEFFSGGSGKFVIQREEF